MPFNFLLSTHRCQNRLGLLGFPVLPMLELHQSAFGAPTSLVDISNTRSEPTAAAASSQNESIDSSNLTDTDVENLEADATTTRGANNDSDDSPEADEASSSEAEPAPAWYAVFNDWAAQHGLVSQECFVVKPAEATQSRQAWLVNTPEMLQQRAQQIFSQASAVCCCQCHL